MISRFTSALGAVAVVAVGFAEPTQAQTVLTPGSPSCDWALSSFSPIPNANPQCLGSFSGNPQTQWANVIATITNAWGGGFVDLGKSDDVNFGPFTSNPDQQYQGWLNLDSPLSGDFALILKGSNRFSIYGYTNVTLSSIYFTTAGVSTNKQGTPQALSHAQLLQRPGVPVPEPASAVLMLTGLVGLAAARRRRETA